MENLTFNCEIFRIIVALKELTILLYIQSLTSFCYSSALQLFRGFKLCLPDPGNVPQFRNQPLSQENRKTSGWKWGYRLMFSLTSIEELIDNSWWNLTRINFMFNELAANHIPVFLIYIN